jgi:heat shock protein HslJ
LAAFIEGLATWRRSGGDLVLLSADGTEAVLRRRREPNPELAGRWLIESVGGEPFLTERRPPTLTIGMKFIGAGADCNSTGAPFSVPGPGEIRVTGPVVSMSMGCAPEDEAEDALLRRALDPVRAYRVEGDRLELTGGPGLVARRQPAPVQTLRGDYESCGSTLLGAIHEGPITLTIDSRTMRDAAGCSAAWTADGPLLRIAKGGEAACAREPARSAPGEGAAVGGNISILAAAPPDAYAFDPEGRLILRTPLGLLSLCRKDSTAPSR